MISEWKKKVSRFPPPAEKRRKNISQITQIIKVETIGRKSASSTTILFHSFGVGRPVTETFKTSGSASLLGLFKSWAILIIHLFFF